MNLINCPVCNFEHDLAKGSNSKVCCMACRKVRFKEAQTRRIEKYKEKSKLYQRYFVEKFSKETFKQFENRIQNEF